ncbi:monovalent cation/H+ antiporter complex subunit F [Brachybacterium tyrofermentans]|uniref:monovalent cation/H+ antiporter complex subunit F n=1 Tax=Brachybacterium tyrofermentans TaxID=47848 RepID=UPI003FD33E44
MSTFDIILVIYGAVLALTALTVVYRMVVGPTILDRAVSTDSLVVLVVIAMALYTASAKASWAGPAMLGLTGLAFIGTVTFARFVGREEPRAPQLRRDRQESGTSTGPLDAIHVDHRVEEHPPTLTAPVAAIGAEQGISEGAGSSEGTLGVSGADATDGGTGASGASGADGAHDEFANTGFVTTRFDDGAGHSDHFEHGFGAEEGSRGFEVEAHDDQTTDARGSSNSTSSTDSTDSTSSTSSTSSTDSTGETR